MKKGLPANWDTPDMKGFIQYAIEHYRRTWAIAKQVANTASDMTERRDFRNLAFRVMAIPLVYLYDQWNSLSSEQKKRYMPAEK